MKNICNKNLKGTAFAYFLQPKPVLSKSQFFEKSLPPPPDFCPPPHKSGGWESTDSLGASPALKSQNAPPPHIKIASKKHHA